MSFITVIPAAGRGVRFKELGKQYPKCCLPFRGVPIIQHIVERALYAGSDDVRIAVSEEWHSSAILQALGPLAEDKRVRLVLIDDSEMIKGPATTLRLALEDNPDRPLFVMLSDSFVDYKPYYIDFVEQAAKTKMNLVAGMVVPMAEVSRWCMPIPRKGFGSDVISWSDKPDPSEYARMSASRIAAAGYYFIQCASDYTETFDNFNSNTANWLHYHIEAQFSAIFDRMSGAWLIPSRDLSNKNLDFGTLEDYIQNQALPPQRSFNKIEKTGNRSILKSSASHPNKIAAEAHWFTHSPLREWGASLLDFTPGKHSCSITLTRCTGVLLRDAYLYLDRSKQYWTEVVSKLDQLLQQEEASQSYSGAVPEFWSSYMAKNRLRVEEVMEIAHLGAFNEKTRIVAALGAHETRLKGSSISKSQSFYHGDLHLGNMFYDQTNGLLQLIDPRGEIYGHWAYDAAKLLHSLKGKYDFIEAGLYQGTINSAATYYDKGCESALEAFYETNFWRARSENERELIDEITAFLFLTMIPLHNHSDHHQKLLYREFWRLLGETQPDKR